MARTAAELIAQIEEDTGRSDKSTEIGDYLNDAQIFIARGVYDPKRAPHIFSCLLKESTASTADGTKSYTWPTNLRSIYDVRLSHSTSVQGKLRPLLPMSQDIIRGYPEGDSEGEPVRYIPWGLGFELSPIPDDAYTMSLRWLKWPDDISGTTVSDLLYVDDVIIKCGDWLAATSLNLEKDIKRFKSDFMDLFVTAIKADQSKTSEDVKMIATRFIGGRVELEPGEAHNAHAKPGWLRMP